MKAHTFRLLPGQDLLEAIEAFVQVRLIAAGCVLSSVGSLTHATLRLANRKEYSAYEGHFEILTLNGTVSLHGSHLHLALADGDGNTFGGHLVAGCKIYTTAELVIAEFPELSYRREPCEQSGYDELVVYPAGAGGTP